MIVWVQVQAQFLINQHTVPNPKPIKLYEDGDFGFRARGGSVNSFACHSLESDWRDLIFAGYKVER